MMCCCCEDCSNGSGHQKYGNVTEGCRSVLRVGSVGSYKVNSQSISSSSTVRGDPDG